MASALDDVSPVDTPLTFTLAADGRTLVREAVRVGLVAAFVALFAYSMTRAWVVLGALESVTLRECGRLLDVVSVRDALLCMVGWSIGKELLRACTRRRQPAPR